MQKITSSNLNIIINVTNPKIVQQNLSRKKISYRQIKSSSTSPAVLLRNV